ncbi:MAG: thioredoxin domain-containing protein [Candidatus Uhrbacteria bacterium]|nr:thioredoxin domain-containing protein [Candidatus Uhrbacteria bacterium]
MQSKYIWIFIGTFILAAGLGAIFFGMTGAMSLPSLQSFWPDKKSGEISETSSAYTIRHAQSDIAASVGPKNAKVVVVEFLDFQCPFCKASHPTILRLLKEYADQSVRFEFRNFPITSTHPFALPAALASLCAHEQGKFLDFYTMAYTRQEEISLAGLSTFAKDLDLNLASYNACMAEKRYEPFVKKDVDDALALSVEGTPTWFVNSTRLVGALSYEAFTSTIDKELNR